MLQLHERDFLARGGERACYQYPGNPELLIKVVFSDLIGRNQNVLDMHYYQYLNHAGISFDCIPKCLGYVETNLGLGLIFEAVRDYDKKLSETLESVIEQRVLGISELQKLLDEFKCYIRSNNILLGDVVLTNFLCQQYEEGCYKIVVIDGLGGRRFSLKYRLALRSSAYNRYRVDKQLNKLMGKVTEATLNIFANKV